MTDRPRTDELWTPPIEPREPGVWMIHRHRPFYTTDLDGPHAARVRVVEDLGPEAMLAWALRCAGRERVVPIIEQAARLSSVRLSHRPDEARVLAVAVFDALTGNDE